MFTVHDIILVYHSDLVVFLVLCIEHPYLKIIADPLWSNRPIGKVVDNCVKTCISIKDSCDGSGLNTSENSKDSNP